MARKTNSNYATFVKDVLADAGEFKFEVVDSQVLGTLYVMSKDGLISTITEKSVRDHVHGNLKQTLDWQLDEVDQPGWLKADEWDSDINKWLVYFNNGFRPYQWFGANSKTFDSVKTAIEEVNVITKKKCKYEIDTESLVIRVLN